MGGSVVVQVSIRGKEGQPIADARCYFTSAPVSLPDIAALSDESGTAVLSVPVAGRYTVACAAEGHATVEREVAIPAQGPFKVEVTLPAA